MTRLTNVMDVFKLLEKSNCRKCNEKTCLAFAAAVFDGRRPLSDCPQIPAELRQLDDARPRRRNHAESDMESRLAKMKSRLKAIEFAAAAHRIGAGLDGEKLVLRVMGKAFRVDAEGRLYTDIHTNPWVTAPILHYILHCKGVPVTGRWLPLRELPSGKDWYRLFGQLCEKPMKKIADEYPDLFADLIGIFDGQPADDQHQSDVAVVLHPLPYVPLLICYWHPEEGMESALNLFFDASAEENLGIDGLYALGTGITRMFEKLALRHGIRRPVPAP